MSKTITQYDGRKIVARYSTIMTASRVTGTDQSHISKVARGVRNTAGGYKWRYARGNIFNSLKRPGGVVQLDKTGNIVAIYSDMNYAAQLSGSNIDRIADSMYSYYMTGRGRIVKGYRFVPISALTETK
jgi:hypothetical protein